MDHGREEKGRRRKRGEWRKARSSITTVKKRIWIDRYASK